MTKYKIKYKIDLFHVEQPMLILIDEKANIKYTNQINGCVCDHKSVPGYLVPLNISDKYKNLFSPTENYLNFNFDKSKNLYKDYLETSGDSTTNPDIKNVRFIDNECCEAWLTFTFSSDFFFSQESFNSDEFDELTKKKNKIEFDYFKFLIEESKIDINVSSKEERQKIHNTYRHELFEKSNKRKTELFKSFIEKSDNYSYRGVLTWQNSD